MVPVGKNRLVGAGYLADGWLALPDFIGKVWACQVGKTVLVLGGGNCEEKTSPHPKKPDNFWC
jgi:hypothetical protein